MNLKEHAATVSRFKKERYLRQLSEDEFRDRIVRPLLLRRGLKDGRDYCGPREAGKDAIFVAENALKMLDIFAVQTKKGHLNLGKKRSTNVVEAATQLTTALHTSIILLATREKRTPNRAILCASGKINDNARIFICEEVKDPNLLFLDSDELIPLIDDLMPELWCDIDVDLFPYLRNLKRSIERDTQLFTKGELISADLPPVAASDDSFIPLRVFRYVLKAKTIQGKPQQIPEVESFPITGLLTRKEPLTLLLGGAGSGKSTGLLRIAYMLCEKAVAEGQRQPTPVFFRAAEIASHKDNSLLDLCIARGQEIGGTQKSPISSQDLESGLLIVLIDALDELADIDAQRLVVAKTVDLVNQYPKCRAIIASRDYQELNSIDGIAPFTQFNITPINYKQALKIIERLHKKESLPISESSEFLRRIQDVHGLELNPLIVTVFAASSDYSKRDIPANITELFKKFTELMLGRWDTKKGVGLQYQAPLKDFVLTRIGYALHARKETRLSIHELKQLIASELEARGHKADIDILTDEILNRSGLFRTIGEKVEFRHLMLQEYFAGRGLPSSGAVYTLVPDSWWRRALVFYFGEKPNEAELLKSVTEKMVGSSAPAIYQAAITIGLGLQASYLVEVSAKLPLVAWVICALASVFHDYEKSVVDDSRYPLREFINYYLFARDAVAFCVLKDNQSAVSDLLTSGDDEVKYKDLKIFWLIVGLIETGDVAGAEQQMENFHPADRRLYLGVYLGTLLVQYLKVTTPEEYACAKRMCDSVSKHLPDLRKQLVEEFKTELLEVQKGRIAAVSASSASE